MLRCDRDLMQAAGHAMARGLGSLAHYLDHEMDAGRLRRLHPLLAIQLLAGPLFADSLTRPASGHLPLGFDMPGTSSWTRWCRPGCAPWHLGRCDRTTGEWQRPVAGRNEGALESTIEISSLWTTRSE